jgi:hypothetical protein
MNKSLSDILDDPQSADYEQRAKQGDIWNIFVQILLPLLLISTFFAFWVLMVYKKALDDRIKTDAQSVIADSTSDKHKNLQSELEIQRKKLLEAYNTVAQEEHVKLNYYLIEGKCSGRIIMNKKEIIDTAFLILCKMALEKYNTDEAKSVYFKYLYDRILTMCGLTESKTQEVQVGTIYSESNFRSLCDDSLKSNELLYMAINSKSVISPGNTCFIKGYIYEFINRTRKEVIGLQGNVYQRVCSEILDDTSCFRKSLYKNIFTYLNNIRDQDAKSYVKEFEDSVKQYVSNNYSFLEDAMKIKWGGDTNAVK